VLLPPSLLLPAPGVLNLLLPAAEEVADCNPD
jgi:hypothetical protein